MRLMLLLLVLIQGTVVGQNRSITTDRGQAQEAFQLLNNIRMNPEKYAKELGITNIDKVTRTRLVWNDDLAKVAEFRAYDMANRNYFEHTTPEGLGPNYYIAKVGYKLNPKWTEKRSTNNFESIAANHRTAEDGIRAFIIGKGSPGFMHRKHVLGMDNWNGSLVDIGIGFVHSPAGSQYKTYLCVIIAKHDW